MSNGGQINLYGDGNSHRDYTFIADIIDGLMAAIKYDESLYKIIKLAQQPHSAAPGTGGSH